MKSRLLNRRRSLQRTARSGIGLPHRPLNGLSKTERNRRLTSLGLSRHDDEEIQKAALAIVEQLKMIGDSGTPLLMLDRQLATRSGGH